MTNLGSRIESAHQKPGELTVNIRVSESAYGVIRRALATALEHAERIDASADIANIRSVLKDFHA